MSYAELAVTTNFSFLHGASHPPEFVRRAQELDYAAIGIADRNTLAGVVRAYGEWKDMEEARRPQLLIGARLVFRDGTPDILAYPKHRKAYGRLSRLLSIGKLRAQKGECLLDLSDLLEHRRGLQLIVMPPPEPESIKPVLSRLGSDTWLAASLLYTGEDRRRLRDLVRLARAARVPLIAVNDALYHHPERRELQDVVTCIREHATLQDAGTRLQANAERHLKTPAEMRRLFRACPDAVEETLRFARGITFTLAELGQRYPREPVPRGKTADRHLRDLTEEGLKWRYPQGVPRTIAAIAEKELRFIAEGHIAHYFLTVHDIVKFARSQGILCQGRGSAANSVVCYAIGVTAVDPNEVEVLFERFLNTNRREPPDIDVDFEHERREEVIQYIYRRYGHRRAALTAFRETEDALAAAKRLDEQAASAMRQRDALAEGLRLATNRYREGYSPYLEQLDAQRQLLGVQLQLAQVRADALAARVQLYQAMGGGWSMCGTAGAAPCDGGSGAPDH